MNKNQIFNVVFVVLSFLLIYPYFVWESYLMTLLFAILTLIIYLKDFSTLVNWKYLRYSVIYFFFFLLLFFISFIKSNILPTPFYFLSLIVTSIFISLNPIIKNRVFMTFTLLLAVIFGLGVIEYFLITFEKAIKIGMAVLSAKEELIDELGTFEVFLFNLKPVYILGIHRFQSIFDEPGVVGTLSAFYIFSVKYNDNKLRYIIFLLSGIISFSLAFYFLFLVRICLSVNFIRNILAAAIVATIVYFTFFDGLDLYILSRLSDTENIDNRSTEYFDKIFNHFVHTNDIYLGNGVGFSSLVGEGVSTWKVIIMDFGFFGFLIILGLNLWLIIKSNKDSKRALLLVVVFSLSFYQRPNINYIPVFILLLGGQKIVHKLENNKSSKHITYST